MSQYIKEFDNLIGTKDFVDYILNYDLEFTPSVVYSVDTKEKLYDLDQRQSSFRRITTKEAFQKAQIIIKEINKLDTVMNYNLIKSDITHIKYQEGDFFKPHQDFLGINSNLIEEYTMIICLRADCQGGETKFHINQFFSYSSSASKTPLNVVIFRKDLMHEGVKLESGYKEIATINIYGIPTTSERTVMITSTQCERKLLLPLSSIENIPRNMILGSLSFTHQLESDDKILTYQGDYNEQQFDLIEKIFKRAYISYSEYDKSSEFIDFLGIDDQYLLISKPKLNIEDKKHIVFDNGIQLFTSLEDMQEFERNTIKIQKEDFVSFTLMLAEGEFTLVSNNVTITKFPMEIILSYFTENNLFYKQRYQYNEAEDDTPLKLNYDNVPEIPHEYYLENSCEELLYRNISFIATYCKYKNKNNINAIIQTYIQELLDDKQGSHIPILHKVDLENLENYSKYYNLDTINDKLVLKNRKTFCKYLEEINFEKLILDNIKDIKIIFPQNSTNDSGSICNETLYSEKTFITLYGAIPLQYSVDQNIEDQLIIGNEEEFIVKDYDNEKNINELVGSSESSESEEE